jgi:GT2 family glycosyltransferase
MSASGALGIQPGDPGGAPTDSGPVEVSILLVNWNTRDMTLECLASIYRQTTRVSFEVIVVDNGSTDGSAPAIAAAFPQVTLLAEDVNHGFAAATNMQARLARGEKLLLLNTDTVVLDHAIDALAEFARENPKARIWGGRTLFGDGSLNRTSCWRKMSPWSVLVAALGLTALAPGSALFNPRGYPGWARDSERRVDIVTGCLLMVDRQMWNSLDGFDPRFFMYGEDADLCLRACALGAAPMITPAATIIHYGGGSSVRRAAKLVRLLSAELALIGLHFPKGTRGISRLCYTAGVALRAGGYALSARLAPARYKASAREWGETWARRGEWAKRRG